MKEVLGPRDGPYEILPEDQNPLDEYITGVLAPAKAPHPPDEIDAGSEELIELPEETSSEDDQDNHDYVVVPGSFSPALDSQSSPHSIDLSCSLEASAGLPQIEICAT